MVLSSVRLLFLNARSAVWRKGRSLTSARRRCGTVWPCGRVATILVGNSRRLRCSGWSALLLGTKSLLSFTLKVPTLVFESINHVFALLLIFTTS